MPARSHRDALQHMAGDALHVLAYVRTASPACPAQGWYGEPTNGHRCPERVWEPAPGVLYLGADICQAAHTIATVQADG